MYKRFKNITNKSSLASIFFDEKTQTVYLNGCWSWDAIDEDIILTTASKITVTTITLNGLDIKKLDTIGAFFLHKLLNIFDTKNIN